LCHGVYVLEHPILREDDCVVGKNLTYFGICIGKTPPNGAEEILLDQYIPEGGIPTGKEVKGPKCKPDMIGEWRNTHEETKVTGEEFAVTTSSYLVCRCGGLIQPLTSGQEYEDKGDKPDGNNNL